MGRNSDISLTILRQYVLILGTASVAIAGLLTLPNWASFVAIGFYIVFMWKLTFGHASPMAQLMEKEDKRFVGFVLRSTATRVHDDPDLAHRLIRLAHTIDPGAEKLPGTKAVSIDGGLLGPGDVHVDEDGAWMSERWIVVECERCHAMAQVPIEALPPGINPDTVASLCPKCVTEM